MGFCAFTITVLIMGKSQPEETGERLIFTVKKAGRHLGKNDG